MESKETIIQEVQRICHGLLEEVIDPSQIKRLEELVANYQEARSTYVGLMNLHSTLMRYRSSAALRDGSSTPAACLPETGAEHEASKAGSSIDDPVDRGPLFDLEKSGPLSDLLPERPGSSEGEYALKTTVTDVITQALPTAMKNTLSSSAFFAGTVTFSIGIFFLMIFMFMLKSSPVPSSFARVSQTVDAVWANGTGNGDLSQLCIGKRLELESGLAQVEYQNGVRVNLEGPSIFIVAGLHQGVLVEGKASALVENVPTGFFIRTPIGKVIDLGTEFGVKVSSNRDTEVQVFDGKVKLDIAGIRSPSKKITVPAQTVELYEKEAVTVDSKSHTVQSTPYVPDQFARTYRHLKRYYFDDFSSDTSSDYVGTHSIWGKEGDYVITDGKLVAEVKANTYSIFSRNVQLGPGEIFAVNVPAPKPNVGVFLIVSSAIGEPQGGSDGGIGFRLRREYGEGIVIQQNDLTQGSYGDQAQVFIDASRIEDPAPEETLRLFIKRQNKTDFVFYYEHKGARTKIYGPVSLPDLGDVEGLYVGVEVSNQSDQKEVVTFDNLSVRPINK